MYKVKRNPMDGKWYVIGHCRDGIWMPVSLGYKTKKEVTVRLSRQKMADIDAKNCLYAI